RKLLLQQHPYGVDLIVGNRASQSASSDQHQYAVFMKHPRASAVAWCKSYKYVTTEQRHFHSFSPVAPPMHRFEQRQERRYSLVMKPLRHHLLVSSSRLDRKPRFGICTGVNG